MRSILAISLRFLCRVSIRALVIVSLLAAGVFMHAWASMRIDGLMQVNHVRFACAFTDQASGSRIDEKDFCAVALSALTDLAVGHLDKRVATETPWSTISDPDAAVQKCFRGIQGIPIAGSCDRDFYQLYEADRPLAVSLESTKASSISDPSGVMILVQAHRSSIENINVSVLVIEPSNQFVAEQRKKEITELIGSTDPLNQRSLHEELQVVMAGYFLPVIINEIKANDIIRSRSNGN